MDFIRIRFCLTASIIPARKFAYFNTKSLDLKLQFFSLVPEIFEKNNGLFISDSGPVGDEPCIDAAEHHHKILNGSVSFLFAATPG